MRQLDLFAAGGAPGFDRAFRTLHRTALAHGAWIDHAPGWVHGHDALFDELEKDLGPRIALMFRPAWARNYRTTVGAERGSSAQD